MEKENMYNPEKSEEHFEHARRIIESWPKWKQEIGFAPISNLQQNYKSKKQ